MTTEVSLPVDQLVKSEQGQRGFTLTEIAIVLGIIGLILGAIWVAASAVYNNLRVSKATTELLQITQAVRALYATSSITDPNASVTVLSARDAAIYTYYRSGIFPNDTLVTATGGSPGPTTPPTAAQDPWAGGIAITDQTSNGGSIGDSFQVTFDSVPTAACIAFLTSNVGSGRDPGMILATASVGGTGAVSVGNPPATFATSAIVVKPASEAQALCNNHAAGSAVAFSFRLKG